MKEKELIRKIMAVAGTVLIGIALSVVIVYYSGVIFVEEFEKDMVNGLEGTVRQYKGDVHNDELYETSTHEIADDIIGYAVHYLDKHGVNQKSVDALDDLIGQYLNYYVFSGSVDDEQKVAKGFFFYQEKRPEMNDFTKEELYKIISDGVYLDEGIYTIKSRPLSSGGYFLARYRCTQIFTRQSALKAYSDDSDEFICRIDESTGIVEDSSDEAFIGTSYYDFIGSSNLDGIPQYSSSVIKRSRGSYSLAAKSESVNGDVFVSVIPMSILLPTILRNSLLGIVLCWCFLGVILVYVIRFSRNVYREDTSVQFVKIFRNSYVDKHFVSHVGGLTLYAAVLVILSMLYVQTMTNYSTQNVTATADLKGLEQHIKLDSTNAEEMTNDFYDCGKVLSELISNYYVAFPGELSNESLKEFVSCMPTLTRVTIYDVKGISQYDSMGVPDMALARDDGSGDSSFWRVLTGESTLGYGVVGNGEKSEYYIATPRQDSKGMIRISIYGKYFDEFMQGADLIQYLSTANMGASERGYIDKDDPEYVKWVNVGQTDYSEYTNTFAENVLTNGFSGVVRFQNKRQMINVRETEDAFLLCGKSTAYLFGIQSFLEYLIIAVLLFLHYTLLVLLGIRKKAFVDANDTLIVSNPPRFEEIVRDRTMDKTFRKISFWMILVSMLMIVITLIIDSKFGHTSIISYLMESQWSKGINLFSLTMIIVLIAIVSIGGKILETLVIFFTKNMGPRGVTIGKMACSMIKFAALIIIIVFILVDLGANLKGLLASAGIVGAVLTLCANQTINDLVSGFLIIFEDIVNVGDWITVDGFRGEVIEIGVRTTKVSALGQIKVVNNSDMRTFMIMGGDMQGAHTTVDIAYKEDVGAVVELLQSKEAFFREQIPDIEDGPHFEGIVELGASGVTIRIWARGHRDRIGFISREMLKITKEILDENNIEIPFNQVTIHNADKE